MSSSLTPDAVLPGVSGGAKIPRLGARMVSPFPVKGALTAQGSPLLLGPARAAIPDLDCLPFVDRSLIDVRKYLHHIGEAMVHGAISILASRGCPYSCTYCHRIMSKKLHFRSPENIFEEVRFYYELGFQRFSFVDDIFNLRRDVTHPFYEMLIKNNYKVQIFFPNGLRGDVLTKDDIDLMAEAGVVNFALALETASPRLQKAIKKNLKLDRLKENIEYIVSRHGKRIMLDLFIMMGFPTETKEELEVTFDFVKSIRWLHFPVLSMVQIYPGSDMVEFALENGVSMEAIENTSGLQYHEAPATLPWPISYAREKQVEFFTDYFLDKERLLHVLPIQMRHLREEEIVQKYNSILPQKITDFDGLLKELEIIRAELGPVTCTSEWMPPEHALAALSTRVDTATEDTRLKLLLVDLSTLFAEGRGKVYSVLDQPLGMLYLLTNVNRMMGERVTGRIVKSAVDFHSLPELNEIIADYAPDVIGARTLSCYKRFFHDAIRSVKERFPEIPIIGGGPYMSSDYSWALDDRNIAAGVIGEGEFALVEILEAMLRNDRRLPDAAALTSIAGVAAVDR